MDNDPLVDTELDDELDEVLPEEGTLDGDEFDEVVEAPALRDD